MSESFSGKSLESVDYPLILTNSIDKNKKNNGGTKKITKLKQKPKKSFNIKKSYSLNNIINPNDIDNSRTIELINSINLSQNNKIKYTKNNSYALDLFSKHKVLDDESLQMRNRQLKSEINKIKYVLHHIKRNNILKDDEISKQEILIDQILNINKQAYLNTLSSLENNAQSDIMKNYKNNIIYKINQQYQQLLKETKNKEAEIKDLKKNIKNSKMNELIIENNIITKQYNKYNTYYNHIINTNKNYEKKMKNQTELENEIFQKNFEILQLQENLKLGNAMNIEYEREAEDLKNKIREYEYKNKNMKMKIKKLNQEFNEILLAKKEVEDNFFIVYNQISNLDYNYNNINNISIFSNINGNDESNKINNKYNFNNNGNKNLNKSNTNLNNRNNNLINSNKNLNNSCTYEQTNNNLNNSNKNLNNSHTYEQTNNNENEYNYEISEKIENEPLSQSNKEIKFSSNGNDIINLNNKFNSNINNEIDEVSTNTNNINTNINNEELIKLPQNNKIPNDSNNIHTIDEENIITNIESGTNYNKIDNNNSFNIEDKKQLTNNEKFPIEYNSENNRTIKKVELEKRIEDLNNIKTKNKNKFNESYIEENFNLTDKDYNKNDELNKSIGIEEIRDENNLNNENIDNIIEDENKINLEEEDKDNKNYDIQFASYLLIKNFEAREMTKENALTLIIKPILNEIGENKEIEKNSLINLFANKISESIGVQIKKDFEEIENIITILLIESKNDLSNFIDNFLKFFDHIKNYNECGKEEEYIRQINIELSGYKEYFINSYDKKIIPFSIFRQILNNKNIQLDNEIIEYLIYRMKKDCCNLMIKNDNNLDEEERKNISIFDLCYQTLLNII